MSPPKYKLLESDNIEQWIVAVEDGELAGLTFKFGEIRLTEEGGEFATIKFEYDIINPIENPLTKEQADTIIGAILQNVIEDALEYQNERINRSNDPTTTGNE